MALSSPPSLMMSASDLLSTRTVIITCSRVSSRSRSLTAALGSGGRLRGLSRTLSSALRSSSSTRAISPTSERARSTH